MKLQVGLAGMRSIITCHQKVVGEELLAVTVAAGVFDHGQQLFLVPAKLGCQGLVVGQ